ncbi:uracil-DNA glycosylase [Pararhodobacter sp. SW119]|uniref:uracil-DNA glycosylase n=1 Tax=Pararhodobacter sp. SW119 TaxID=2780075 RepID=UPI001AE094F6|nr:uracil-DNA glycosylase [Pararhodobacter sp. SW119]
MTAGMDWHLARALLEWQVELGATEAIADAPIDRFTARADPTLAPPESSTTPTPTRAAPARTTLANGVDPVSAAEAMAAAAPDLPALAEAVAAYPHCDLRKGARNTVFSDGNPAARVMLIGEGPGREEDQRGLPFVGAAGQLLDRMFAAIGLSRTSPDTSSALYITNAVPWRPPGNREPTAEELAMLRPFLVRHVELADPAVIVLLGNTACQAILGRRGIMRLRGHWTDAIGRPCMPTLHPANLLRSPENKREVWSDLLEIKARLRKLS